MEEPLDLGLKRERRFRPILLMAGFFAGIAGLAWSRGVGEVAAGREGAGVAGGTTELGGVTGTRLIAVERGEEGLGVGGGVEGDGDEAGLGAGGGVEGDADGVGMGGGGGVVGEEDGAGLAGGGGVEGDGDGLGGGGGVARGLGGGFP